MNHSRGHDDRLNAKTAERLLRGEGSPEETGRIADLALLLSKASEHRAGRPADARTVFAAFRTQRDERRVRKARLAKAAIGGCVAVLALGGVAIAAERGVLPHPFGPSTSASRPWHPATPAAPGRLGQPAHRPAPRSTATPDATPHPPHGSGPAVAPAPPSGTPTPPGQQELHGSHGESSGHDDQPATPTTPSMPLHGSMGKAVRGHTGGEGNGNGNGNGLGNGLGGPASKGKSGGGGAGHGKSGNGTD